MFEFTYSRNKNVKESLGIFTDYSSDGRKKLGRLKWERIKNDPIRHERWKARKRESYRRQREKFLKMRTEQEEQITETFYENDNALS